MKRKSVFKVCYRSLTTGREVFSATLYNSEESAQKVANRLADEARKVGRPVSHSVVEFFQFD